MKLKNYTLVYFFCFSAFIMLAQDKQNTSSFIRPSLTLIEVTHGGKPNLDLGYYQEVYGGSLIKSNELKFSPGIDITNIKTQSINIGDKRAFDEEVMAATFKIASDLI